VKIKAPIALGVLLASVVALMTARVAAAPETAAPQASARRGADAILRELLAGNERFASGKPINPRRAPDDFRSVAASQNPSAVVITCADSRVPPELLFDEGVGDLFVVRVAGNVVSGAGAAVKGSVEYAVAELNVPLVIILGHTGCGAVKSAVKHIDAKDSLPGSINELVELVKPAVLEVRGRPGDLVENAIRANVSVGVDKLMTLQPILGPRVKDGRLKIVGGVYDLSTGKVTMN
jgi:carbonic anhydrase